MNKRPKSREETPKEGSDSAGATAPQQYATALHKTQVFYKHFQRNIRQAGGYATGWLNTYFLFIFSALAGCIRKIPRDGYTTIPKNLNFVIGAVIENARLSEADSKACKPHLVANNAASTGARPAGLS